MKNLKKDLDLQLKNAENMFIYIFICFILFLCKTQKQKKTDIYNEARKSFKTLRHLR